MDLLHRHTLGQFAPEQASLLPTEVRQMLFEERVVGCIEQHREGIAGLESSQLHGAVGGHETDEVPGELLALRLVVAGYGVERAAPGRGSPARQGCRTPLAGGSRCDVVDQLATQPGAIHLGGHRAAQRFKPVVGPAIDIAVQARHAHRLGQFEGPPKTRRVDDAPALGVEVQAFAGLRIGPQVGVHHGQRIGHQQHARLGLDDLAGGDVAFPAGRELGFGHPRLVQDVFAIEQRAGAHVSRHAAQHARRRAGLPEGVGHQQRLQFQRVVGRLGQVFQAGRTNELAQVIDFDTQHIGQADARGQRAHQCVVVIVVAQADELDPDFRVNLLVQRYRDPHGLIEAGV